MTVSPAMTALHAQAKNSSFHKAMLLLPREKRKSLLTLYAVCRALDDAVDDAPSAEDALSGLLAWQTQLDAAFSDTATPDAPLAQDFQRVHRRIGFAREDMQALLAALQMDVENRMCRPSHAELDSYCYGVASAVGLMSMRIFGGEGEEARRFAIALGHALQRTNILRDVLTDAGNGRIYLPREWLHDTTTPEMLLHTPSVAAEACARLGAEARGFFMEAEGFTPNLPTRAIAPALAMRDVYALYWQKLSASGWQPPANGKIRLSTGEKAALAARASGYTLGYFKPLAL